MTTSRRIQFGVFFQGVNFGTIWSSDRSGSQYDFESFRRIAQTAERGLFSAFFLGEGLRLREHFGRIHDLDIAGRPDAQTQLAALSAVTERIGLVATQNTTCILDPYDSRTASELARSAQRGTRRLEHRHHRQRVDRGELRRGGYLDHADRYRRAAQFVGATQRLWDAGAEGVGTPSRSATTWCRRRSRTPPPSPRRPVLSKPETPTRAASRRVERRRHLLGASGTRGGDRVAADMRRRLPTYGRGVDELKFFPGAQSSSPRPTPRPVRRPNGRRHRFPADRDPLPRADLGPRPLGVRRRGPSPTSIPSSTRWTASVEQRSRGAVHSTRRASGARARRREPVDPES